MEQFACSRTVLASHIRYKKEIMLAPDVLVKIDSYLKRKYLSMKGVFLAENHISDNVSTSLASVQQTRTRVRTMIGTVCIQVRKQILRECSHLFAQLDKQTVGKKKEKVFFLFCFPY
jgi:hypothetical protein